MKTIQGLKISSGTAVGIPFIISRLPFAPEDGRKSYQKPELELQLFERSLLKAGEQLRKLEKDSSENLGDSEASIFSAQLLMLDDPMLTGGIRELIEQGNSAHTSIISKTLEIRSIFEAIPDPYLKERAADVEDVGRRILKCFLGLEDISDIPVAGNVILVADELTPSETAGIRPGQICGIITRKGGTTGHAAIIARTLGLPSLSGIQWKPDMFDRSMDIIIDGDEGRLIIDPDNQTLEKYREKIIKAAELSKELRDLSVLNSRTADGTDIQLWGNIASPGSARDVLENQGKGIGLFRTEFLFMDRTGPPSEEEQIESYASVLREMAPHPVVIRTLDAGGDKEIPYLKAVTGEENNPFLGLRAIRLCLKEPGLLKNQFRALLRAAPEGRLRIMLPMITSLDEVLEAKDLLQHCAAELEKEKTPYAMPEKMGIMIEVPSTVLIARELALEVDFFSIGTNDLTQYTLACDRMNNNLDYLYDHFHPAVLRMIAMTAEAAAERKIEIGMCGEMAGDRLAIPFLIGAGLKELSMTPAIIPSVKKLVRSLDLQKTREITQKVLSMSATSEIRQFLSDSIKEIE